MHLTTVVATLEAEQSCPDGPFKFLLNCQDHGINKALRQPPIGEQEVCSGGACARGHLHCHRRAGHPAVRQRPRVVGQAGKGMGLS
eukprot:3767780-Pleurochrysis_carterae.AAC.1